MPRRRVMAAAGIAAVALAAACSSPSAPTPTVTVSVTPTTTATSSTTTTTAATLQQAFAAVQAGVVRIEVATCDGNAQGSGFYVAPDLVVTAAHVVADSSLVRVIGGTNATAARVIGQDPDRDVALLRTAAPLGSTALRFSSTPAAIGDQVAAIGFTLGQPLSFKPGTVNAVERKAEIDGVPRYGLIEIDAPTNHGNSGGPVVNAAGEVVGIVDAGPEGQPGLRLAVPAAVAAQRVSGWRAARSPLPAAACPMAYGPDGVEVPLPADPTAARSTALHTLSIYFQSINDGDYPTAVAQLANPVTIEAFQRGVASSQDREFEVRSVGVDGAAPVVWLSFRSRQEAGKGPSERPGETCTQWSQDYRFAQRNGLWLIDKSQPRPGVPRNAPCPV